MAVRAQERLELPSAASMDFESVIPLIENILVLDTDGKRIAVKYYGDPKCVVNILDGLLSQASWPTWSLTLVFMQTVRL